MRTYEVIMTTLASTTVTVDAETEDEAAEKAHDILEPPTPCVHENFDLTDEWTVEIITPLD